MRLPAYPPEPFRPTQCRHPIRLIGQAVDTETGEIGGVVDVDVRCKRWACEGCGRRLRWLHIKLVKSGIEYHRDHGRMARFLALTFPVDAGAQVDNAEDVARCTALVARLAQEIRRTHAPRLEYYGAKYLGKQVGHTWPKHSRRRTFYAPTTIGRLSKVAGDIAYARGIGNGYFDDPAERPHVLSWLFCPEPRAPPAPDTRPPFERTEAEAVHLAYRRIEEGARLAGIDPDDPMQGEALRAFQKTATLSTT